MARVTVEDCLVHCENRFDLVLKAAARAHRLELGQADAMVPFNNDKPAVLALREIAEGYDVTRDTGAERREFEEAALVNRFLGVEPSVTQAPGYQDDIDAQMAAASDQGSAAELDDLPFSLDDVFPADTVKKVTLSESEAEPESSPDQVDSPDQSSSEQPEEEKKD